MDLTPFRELFIQNTREHLQQMTALALSLEQGELDPDGVAALFRAAHSVKGMAASMAQGGIAELAHALEDLLDRLRAGMPPDGQMADLLLEGIDLLYLMVDEYAAGRDVVAAGDFVARARGHVPAVSGHPGVTVSAARTDGAVTGDGGRQTVRIRASLLDRLAGTVGELLTVHQRLEQLAHTVGLPGLTGAVQELSRLLKGVRADVSAARLLPFSVISGRFPRVVRDLARRGGKEVEWKETGTDQELDRAILEALADPLLHIVRNAVDHGLELPAERLAAGKPAAGTITLAVTREPDRIAVTVHDDGRGMDPDLIVAAARARGVIGAHDAERIAYRQALMLSCMPGVSTAGAITDLSGRGVGMDVAITAVQRLGGSLGIESSVGVGTTITLLVPVTVAIIHVLVVRVAAATLAVPLTLVRRTGELRRETVTVRDGRQVVHAEGGEVPLAYLQDLLGMPATPALSAYLPLLYCDIGGGRVGMVVDEILGHREVYCKPLGRPLSSLRAFCGGAVQGDGSVLLVIDPGVLLAPYSGCAAVPDVAESAGEKGEFS